MNSKIDCYFDISKNKLLYMSELPDATCIYKDVDNKEKFVK